MPAKGISIVAEVHTTTKAGEKTWGATGGGSMGGGGGIRSVGLQGVKRGRRVQKIGGVWGRNPSGCGNPVAQGKSLCAALGCQGSQE